MNDEYRISNDEVGGKSNIESESSNIKPLSSNIQHLTSSFQLPASNFRLSAPVWIFKINASYLHPAEQETQRINILTKKYYVSKN